MTVSRFKIGLKVFSINTNLIPEIIRLRQKDYFQFIELYVVPGTYEKEAQAWEQLGIDYVVHAPHSNHGVNLAQASQRRTNEQGIQEAKKFADLLQSTKIIIHGGNDGSITETIKQLSMLEDQRFLIENKPKIGINNKECIGWSSEQIGLILKSGYVGGLALDFTHASCAAAAISIEVINFIKEFIAFNPKYFHLSDGMISSKIDHHLNLGKGDYDLHKIMSLIPDDSRVTFETPRKRLDNLADFEKDVLYFHRVLKGIV